jgi:hypothetical protein
MVRLMVPVTMENIRMRSLSLGIEKRGVRFEFEPQSRTEL